MFGNLKTQLLLSTVVALTLLSMGIWAVSHLLADWGIAMFIVLAVYILAVNLWFWAFVCLPLKRLTDHAKRISEGSYGVHLEEFDDDEYIKVEPTANILFGFLATIDLKNVDNLKYCVRVLYTLLDDGIAFNINVRNIAVTERMVVQESTIGWRAPRRLRITA